MKILFLAVWFFIMGLTVFGKTEVYFSPSKECEERIVRIQQKEKCLKNQNLKRRAGMVASVVG